MILHLFIFVNRHLGFNHVYFVFILFFAGNNFNFHAIAAYQSQYFSFKAKLL